MNLSEELKKKSMHNYTRLVLLSCLLLAVTAHAANLTRTALDRLMENPGEIAGLTRTEIEHVLFDLNSQLPDIDPSADYTLEESDNFMYDEVTDHQPQQVQSQDQDLKVVANIDSHDHTHHHHHHKTEVPT